MERIEVEAELLVFRSESSNSSSCYINIDGEAAEAIRAAAMTGQWLNNGRKGNFGSAKVSATIGGTTWANSVFPNKESGGWSMPVKKAVCVAEGLNAGDMIRATIAL